MASDPTGGRPYFRNSVAPVDLVLVQYGLSVWWLLSGNQSSKGFSQWSDCRNDCVNPSPITPHIMNQSVETQHFKVLCLMALNMNDPATAAGEASGGGDEVEPKGQTPIGGLQQQDSRRQ